MYRALDVAKYIIYYYNEDYVLNNLKLQKLLYFVQGFFLCLRDRPCFSEDLLAWSWGPGVESVWQKYRKYGSCSIPTWNDTEYQKYGVWDSTKHNFTGRSYAGEYFVPIRDDDAELIRKIVDIYRKKSNSWLMEYIWGQEPYKCTPRAGVIEKAAIKDFFLKEFCEEDPGKVCCFTGHRVHKLNRPEAEIKAELKEAIVRAYNSGYTTFITGMAQGVDIWAGEIVKTIPGARLIAAVPFPGFEARWSWTWKHKYNRLLKQADAVKYTGFGYSKAAYQIRNEWMVDHSDLVIAVFNGQPGGTLNTINYAKQQNKKILVIQG